MIKYLTILLLSSITCFGQTVQGLTSISPIISSNSIVSALGFVPAGGGIPSSNLYAASLFLDGPATGLLNYDFLSLSNGCLYIPSWNANSGTPKSGIYFVNTNGGDMGSIQVWSDHNLSASAPEMLIDSPLNIAIRPGGNGLKDAILQIGRSQSLNERVCLQYDDDNPITTFSDGITAYPYGHSKRLLFIAHGQVGSSAAGIIGVSASTNIDANIGVDYQLYGELRFYSLIPQISGGGFTNYPGKLVGTMKTNGWDFRGKINQQRLSDQITGLGGAFSLDMNVAQLIDVKCGTNGTTVFYTTNSFGSWEDYEKRTFFIRSGPFAPTLTWPSTWSILGASAGGTLPTTLSIGQLLKLEIGSVGIGESNKTVTATLATDSTWYWDTDAQAFFVRVAAIGGSLNTMQSNAVNNLVIASKTPCIEWPGGWWTNCDIIYPMVGGSSNSHSLNLKSTSFNITNTAGAGRYFSGVVTHDANGITGSVAGSGYGDTRFTPSTAGGVFLTNSAHAMIYLGSATTVDGRILSSSPNGANVVQIRRGSGTIECGLNNGNALAGSGTYGTGPIGVFRTSSNLMSAFVGSTSIGGDTTVTTGLANAPIYLLARNDGGADNFSDANIRGATVGGGMTILQWHKFRKDWDNYEAALWRKSP